MATLGRRLETLERATEAELDAELDRLCDVFWRRAERHMAPAEVEALAELWREIQNEPEREPTPAGVRALEKIDATPALSESYDAFVDVFRRWFVLRHEWTDEAEAELERHAEAVEDTQPVGD